MHFVVLAILPLFVASSSIEPTPALRRTKNIQVQTRALTGQLSETVHSKKGGAAILEVKTRIAEFMATNSAPEVLRKDVEKVGSESIEQILLAIWHVQNQSRTNPEEYFKHFLENLPDKFPPSDENDVFPSVLASAIANLQTTLFENRT